MNTEPLIAEMCRATVPLFYVDFDTAGRVELCPGVTLAELTAREAERVRSHHGYSTWPLPAPMFRLEVVFNGTQSSEEKIAEQKVKEALQLLTCATNSLPIWLSIPVDRFSTERGCWIRSSVNFDTGGHRPTRRHPEVSKFFGYPQYRWNDNWEISDSQIHIWSELLKHWPNRSKEKRIAVALEYFAEAVADLLLDERRALLSASICLESLFGDNAPELRHRISQRISHLLGKGRDAFDIYIRAKRWYDMRSRLVHSGATPDLDLTIDAIIHLRGALTALTRLIEITGSHRAALNTLDEASFERGAALLELDSDPKDVWWRLPLVLMDSP